MDKQHVKDLRRQLLALAQIAGPDRLGTGPLELTFCSGNCRYKLRIDPPDAVGLRERADLLEKQHRSLQSNPYGKMQEESTGHGGHVASRREAAPVRRTYSPALAQHYLDSGEYDNWQEYQRKYGRPDELNRYAQ